MITGTPGAAFEKVDRIAMRAALTRLPSTQRRAFELAYFGGHTHTEIADELNMGVSTVNQHMRLGLQALRVELNTQTASDTR